METKCYPLYRCKRCGGYILGDKFFTHTDDKSTRMMLSHMAGDCPLHHCGANKFGIMELVGATKR